MNIGELKKIIKDLPDNMLIGGSGHYGEFLKCYTPNVKKVSENWKSNKEIEIFCISLEDSGHEPD